LEVRRFDDPVDADFERLPAMTRRDAASQEFRLGTMLEERIPPLDALPLWQFFPPRG
jgi:hypothetical protein